MKVECRMSAVKAQFQRFRDLSIAGAVLLGLALGYLATHAIYVKNQPVPGALPTLTFVDRAGQPVTLDEFRGQMVLVNLWATWCPPCVAELPSLEILNARLRDKGFAVVAIALDREGLEKVTAFWDAREIEQLDFYWDKDSQVPRRWTYEGIPTSYLLDRTGKVIKTYNGAYKWDEEEIFNEIAAIVARDGEE